MMSLGALIDALAGLDGTAGVVFSDGAVPGGFRSWRGAYEQLTLGPAERHVRMSVARLRSAAERAVGARFHGCHGGVWVMDRDPPVWADAADDCPGFALGDVIVEPDRVVLVRHPPAEAD